MKTDELEKEFHISSYIVLYKFVLGVIELILGLSFLIFGNRLFNLYYNFRDRELLEDSHFLIVSLIAKLLPYLQEYKTYIILFLILLGLTKIIGAIGLYYKKAWGLDLLIAVTFLLLPFDLISLIRHITLINIIYFVINFFIAFYLVNFRPQRYFENLKKRMAKV